MSWNGPFADFPRELGFPQRNCVVYSMKEMLYKVNLYNRKVKDVFVSLYSFDNLAITGRPDYESARITHLFFDLDNSQSLENARILEKYLIQNDIIYTVIFSGAGFHFYVKTEYPNFLKNKKDAIFNAVTDIAQQVGLSIGINEDSAIDAHTVGNIAQLVRVPNTYNYKRKRYCIPLKNCNASFEEIQTKAERQTSEPLMFHGTKSIDLSLYDREPNKEYRIPTIEVGDTIGIENISIEKFPPCVKQLLTKKFLSHKERFLVITYLRQIGLSLKDTVMMLQKYLDSKIYYHCVYEERQPNFIYARADLKFPSCEKLIGWRVCKVDEKCKFHI